MFSDKSLRRARTASIVIVLSAIAICIYSVVCGSWNTRSSAGLVSVTQPQSAEVIATSVHCARFQDKFTQGGDPAVLDDGVCWIGSQKYGIDTFASTASRDGWLKLAEPLTGVVPKWETATAVVYKSTNS